MSSLHGGLRLVLRLNALSCLGFGGLFLAAPAPVAGFLGAAPVVLIGATGALLVINGLHLLLAAGRKSPIWPEILWFSMGDLLWWLASLWLVATGTWITTKGGIAPSLIVALAVATLGSAQLFLFGMARHGLSARGLWRRLGQSWLAMRTIVKLWLGLLNLVFLASLAFWPAEIAWLTLLAYVATGPLLLGMAAAQGGLTRALGLAHLVPWLPLVPFLLSEAEAQTPIGIYAGVLLAVVGLCLLLDLWDLGRYVRGERSALGA